MKRLIWLLVPVLLTICGIWVWKSIYPPQDENIWLGGRRYVADELFLEPNTVALAAAAGHGDEQEIVRLVKLGADPNRVGRLDFTPLMWSIQVGSIVGFRSLLQLGARLDIPAETGYSAMALVSGPAASREFLRIALQCGGNPNQLEAPTGDTPLFFAVRSGDAERVRYLIAAGAAVNARNKRGITPLMECAITGHFDCAVVLLDKGADSRLALPSGADFRTMTEQGRIIPFWSPNFWWRKKAERLLKAGSPPEAARQSDKHGK